MKILKLTNNITIKVYNDEVEKVLNAIQEKDIIVQLRNGVFNTSYFVAIANENELKDDKNQNEGVLHDGSMVIKHFGSWYVDGEFDEKGNPYKRIDQAYYPEVQRDCVPTRKEYELKYRELPKEERLKLILKGNESPRISGGMKQIGDLTKLIK